MNMRSIFVFAAVFLLATTAGARRIGNTYSVASGCNGCHSTGVAPTIEVTQVTPDPLTAGSSAFFKVRMTSQNGGGAGRFAAFAASVTSDAGTFVASTAAGAETEACPTGNVCPPGKTATRDVTRRPFAGDGTFEWNIELSNLGAGNFNLAVGVNDVNSNGSSSGDHNAAATLAFTVAEGEGEPAGEGEGDAAEGEGDAAEGEGDAAEGEGDAAEGEGEGDTGGGGCSAAGVSSSSAGLLLALGALSRRRRR